MRADQLINKYIYGFFILLLGLFLFLGVKEFFSAFLGSIVFYVLFKPLMLNLTRVRNLKKNVAAVVIILISFLIVVLPVSVLGTAIFNRIAGFTQDPQVVGTFLERFTDRLHHLPFDVNTAQLQEGAKKFLTKNIGNVINSSFGILASILMMYFFLFFMLVNVNKMETSIVHYLPFRRSKLEVFGRELRGQTISNAIGVPLICLAQGLFAFTEYRICDVPEAAFWGILTGLASVIPLVGTGLIWIPVTAYLFMENKDWQGFFVIGYSLLIMSNVDNIIRMVVSNKIGHVHPVTTVLGIIIGLKSFGLPGLVFGPLLISYFFILLKLYQTEYSKWDEEVTQAEHEKSIVEYLRNQFSLFSTAPRKKPEPPQDPPKEAS